MRDPTVALLAGWVVKALCIAAVVLHGAGMLLALLLAVFCAASLLWSAADEMGRPETP